VHVAGDRELTPEEAERTPDRASRHFVGDRLVRDEIISEGRVLMVLYLEREWPDAQLLAEHRREYGQTPFEVLSATESAPGGRRRRHAWSVGADGMLGERSEQELDDEGDILAENRFKPDGTQFLRTEYEYDADGNLVLTRELDADGRLLSEWES
jgi:YD repeat-containing protein